MAARKVADPVAQTFDPVTLAAFRDEIEVDVETLSAGHGARRVTIWIVVVAGTPYVRSYRGPEGRWYQNLLIEPRGAIHVNGRRVPFCALPAADPETVKAVSAALSAKYADDPATPAMLVPSVLGTTLRLQPA